MENLYAEIDDKVSIYQLSDDEREKSDAILFLLQKFTPLILKNIRFYFGKYDEDLLQDGIERFIVLVKDFDINSNVKFNFYIKKNMRFFYLNKRKKLRKEPETCSGDILETVKDYDVPDFEVYSSLYKLDDKEKYIIEENIINEVKLKRISSDMKISYSYAKKNKKSALDKLRKDLV